MGFQELPLFSTLSDMQLLSVAQSLEKEDFASGTEIVRQGEMCAKLFIVINGDVVATKKGGTGAKARVVHGARWEVGRV